LINRFILASASPRRKQILTEAGYQFDIVPAAIDETPNPSEAPKDYVLRLSLEKARKIGGTLPVLGADTVVSIDGLLLGKPGDPNEALMMLKQLVGKTHLVHTGVSVVDSSQERSVVSETAVKFINASDEQLREYILSGEPFDKAGGYGIQGLGAFLIESIQGSYSGVVGLPIEETTQLLNKFGISGVTA
jgi:septum formation protein